MRALHLPGAASSSDIIYDFPSKPPPPSVLQYTASRYPEPQALDFVHKDKTIYKVQVQATALTRGELNWSETLSPTRFNSYGGAVPGHDVVGTIAEVVLATKNPDQKPKFNRGDQVWGLLDFDRDGAAADFAIAFENELGLAPPCPSNINDPIQWAEQLATLPLSGLTAWQALFEHGELASPDGQSIETRKERQPQTQKRILILGAAGSVGLPTIQLARAAGFHITATCSTRSIDFLTSHPHLNPDEIIDYTDPHFTTIATTMRQRGIPAVDLVVDCVGDKKTLKSILLPQIDKEAQSQGCLKQDGGILITIVAPLDVILGAEDAEELGRRVKQAEGDEGGIQAKFFIVKPNGDQLDEIGHLVSQGKLKAMVDSSFELANGREAMEKVEGRGITGRGKVVLRVAP